MSALWSATRTWLLTSWLRWHLPVSRQTALDFAEQEGDASFQALLKRIRDLETILVAFQVVPAHTLPDNRGAELLAELQRCAAEAWPPPGYPPSRREARDHGHLKVVVP